MSAIVSTYNAERFIRGCLNDLERQTVVDRLEILVIDSGSEQAERSIVDEFQERYGNITYERTERETLYAAWNRAINLARGSYVVAANTDDRLRPDAYEVLARELEQDDRVDIAYGDWFTTPNPNETYEDNSGQPLMILRYPEYFPPVCLLHFMLSPGPMFRRSVIDEVGAFDAKYKSAGDLEWNIRFCLKRQGRHVPLPLGLFYINPETLGRTDVNVSETEAIVEGHRRSEIALALYENAGWSVATPADRRRALLDLATRASCYVPPWCWGGPHSDGAFAMQCEMWATHEAW